MNDIPHMLSLNKNLEVGVMLMQNFSSDPLKIKKLIEVTFS